MPTLHDPNASAILPFSATDLDPRLAGEVVELERHLIACCVQGDPGLAEASDVVSPGDFLDPDLGTLFDLLLGLHADGRETVYAADLFDRLRTSAKTNAGLASLMASLTPTPAEWFADLVDLEPTGLHGRLYAERVRDAAVLRRLRHAAAAILRDAQSPYGPAGEMVANAEKMLFDLGDGLLGSGRESLSAVGPALQAELSRIDERIAAGGRLGGIATGYPDLDHHLGGLRPGQLVVVGGRPSAGKTAFGLNVGLNAATRGEVVLFFSLEMPESEIAGRLLSMGSGVPMHAFTRGQQISPDAVRRLTAAADPSGIGGCGLYLDDTSDQPAARILSVTRRAVRRYGVHLVVVDYLQLIRPENPKENRTQQVGLAARRMKQVARECGVPVVLACQLNRQVEGRGGDARPQLSDLRESGEIEQHADAVVLLHVPKNQPTENEVWEAEALVRKNRNGPIGDVILAYRRPVMRFESALRG